MSPFVEAAAFVNIALGLAGVPTSTSAMAPHWLTLTSLPVLLQVEMLKAVPASVGWQLVSARQLDAGSSGGSSDSNSSSTGHGTGTSIGGVGDSNNASGANSESASPDAVAHILALLIVSKALSLAASVLAAAPMAAGIAVLLASPAVDAEAMLAAMEPSAETATLKLRYISRQGSGLRAQGVTGCMLMSRSTRTSPAHQGPRAATLHSRVCNSQCLAHGSSWVSVFRCQGHGSVS